MRTQPQKSTSIQRGFYRLAATPARIIDRAIRATVVCDGDSGEKDPEVYGTLARQYPRQMLHISIRAVDGETPDAARFRSAFEGLPRERWTVFTRVADVEGANLPEMLRMPPATTTAPTSAPTAL